MSWFCNVSQRNLKRKRNFERKISDKCKEANYSQWTWQDSMTEFKFREYYEVKSAFFSCLLGAIFTLCNIFNLKSSTIQNMSYFLIIFSGDCLIVAEVWPPMRFTLWDYPILSTRISAIASEWSRCLLGLSHLPIKQVLSQSTLCLFLGKQIISVTENTGSNPSKKGSKSHLVPFHLLSPCFS